MTTSHYEYEGTRGTTHVFVTHPRMNIYYRDDQRGRDTGLIPLKESGGRWVSVQYGFSTKGELTVYPPHHYLRGEGWEVVLTEDESMEMVEEARVIVPQAFTDLASRMKNTVDGAYRSMEKAEEIYQNYLIGMEMLNGSTV